MDVTPVRPAINKQMMLATTSKNGSATQKTLPTLTMVKLLSLLDGLGVGRSDVVAGGGDDVIPPEYPERASECGLVGGCIRQKVVVRNECRQEIQE